MQAVDGIPADSAVMGPKHMLLLFMEAGIFLSAFPVPDSYTVDGSVLMIPGPYWAKAVVI